MGKIEFVGIVNNFSNTETEQSIVIPENAHYIENEKWLDMFDQLNWFIFTVPIFIILLLIMALKQKKNGILNKEIRNEYIKSNKITNTKKIILTFLKKFFIFVLVFNICLILSMIIHELLHCIAGAISGLDMKFGIDPQMFVGFAYTEQPLTKTQFLTMSLAPLVILGIIPLIILFIKYPKEKMDYKKGLKYWILTCFIGSIIISCSPDIIQSLNFIRNIPNNAVVIEDYWYIPNK